MSGVHRSHLTSACGSDFAPRFEFDSIFKWGVVVGNPNTHKFGASHANQRIENWWSHYKRGFTAWVIIFFKSLVQEGMLVLGHPLHMECVWFVFANFLQQELDIVKEEWNTHYIRRSNFTEVENFLDNCLVDVDFSQTGE